MGKFKVGDILFVHNASIKEENGTVVKIVGLNTVECRYVYDVIYSPTGLPKRKNMSMKIKNVERQCILHPYYTTPLYKTLQGVENEQR